MIRASEARKNVEIYELEIYTSVNKQVTELIEIMDESIEFHSKQGYNLLTFQPYDKSRFTSNKELTLAQEIFYKILTSHGYDIIKNDAFNNFLKIRW